jgi:hypothetical protein
MTSPTKNLGLLCPATAGRFYICILGLVEYSNKETSTTFVLYLTLLALSKGPESFNQLKIEYSDIYLNLKTIAKIDVYSFDLCIIFQSILTQLTTNPTILVPTERHLEEIISRRVYPDTSSLQLLCHTMSTFNILGEDRSSKTVIRIVSGVNDFLFICKRHDHTHRPENLLTRNLISSDLGRDGYSHARFDFCEDVGLDEEAVVGGFGFFADQEFSSLLFAEFDVVIHFIELNL